MAPTEVLAEQHLETFKHFFDKLGITTVILSGALAKVQKSDALCKIATGEAQMIIGTHALIQAGVQYKNLALVITDEQHRFGVRQREALREKGLSPHVLVLTATPIPRTLALIIYGDLDISTIKELPPGRQPVDTFAVPPTYRERILAFIKEQINLGRQAYIVCPSIEDAENQQLKAVLSYVKTIEKHFAGISVECLHGKLSAAEKQHIMQKFSQNEVKILVATTVIEVGINVPNATVMLIENAERFGLSQLHQLRGRVGRGADKSYCVMICDGKSKTMAERMKVMQQTNDGFIIAETDLRLRGPGDFFGTKQHGLPELYIANLYADMDELNLAQISSEETLNADPQLEKSENTALRAEVELMLKVRGAMVL